MIDEVFSSTDISHTCPQSVAQVLGVGLMPVSIWHVWLLKSYDSPFAVGGQPQVNDLALAVLICSMNRKDIGAVLSNDKKMAEAVASIAENWFTIPSAELEIHVLAFNQYLTEGLDGPQFWEDPEHNPVKDRSRCPMEWHLVKMLLNERICQTEEEAWNYSFTRALCWSAVVGETNGSRNYIDPVDRADIEKVNV
jgi:hypothetical protein